MPLKAPLPTPDELADICLTHLLQNPEQLADFMSISGLGADALRRAVNQPSFGRGLIDYVVQNEPLLLAICRENSLSPETVMRVWARLNPAG